MKRRIFALNEPPHVGSCRCSGQLEIQAGGDFQARDTGAIEKFCDEVIAANPGPANDFKSGKTAALNFLKGQVMKLNKG